MDTTQVIAVDLDGTLTLTDTLHESVLSLIKQKPYLLLLLPIWLLEGIAHLKLKVAEHAELDVTSLPYNLPLISWLKKQKQLGKTIVLCTAANNHVAQAVAKHLGFFDEVIASDSTNNLKSANKRRALDKRFGTKGYDYAGNSSADIEVWSGSQHAIVVNANKKIQEKAAEVTTISENFPSEKILFFVWIKALRLHQWVKNLLLFVPIITAHQIDNFQSLYTLILAFVSFGLCASSVYITNDLLDLESDRKHPRKRNRPFAAAKLPISSGVLLAPVLLVISFSLGAIVSTNILIVLTIYFSLTTLYSFLLKRIILIDTLTLALLFTLRIIAGAAAITIPMSFWLMAFSVFIFLSLALIKRYAELIVQAEAGNNSSHGRGYKVADTSIVQTLGVSAGYISVLIIALYVHSKDVISLYALPEAIFLALPVLLFWISWVWLKANRGEMHDDPIVFAAKDKASLAVAGVTAIVFFIAANGLGSL